MASRLPELILFAGRSNKQLSKSISDFDGLKLAKLDFIDFANGEMKVRLNESVRGDDVFILQTAAPPCPEKWMMELFLLAHTAKKASARRITAVVPYIYGSRQDRKSEARTPITIQLIGDLMQAAGIQRLLTVSLHNQASVAGFGDILVDNLSSTFLFSPILDKLHKKEKFLIMSPDAGGVSRAQAYANHLNAELGFCYKTRPKTNESAVIAFVGDVKDRSVLVIDDIIDTAGSLITIAKQAIERGATKVYACATHAILSSDASKKIEECKCFEKIFITDSIEHDKLPDLFEVVSLGALLGDTIVRINSDKSVGALWEKERFS